LGLWTLGDAWNFAKGSVRSIKDAADFVANGVDQFGRDLMAGRDPFQPIGTALYNEGVAIAETYEQARQAGHGPVEAVLGTGTAHLAKGIGVNDVVTAIEGEDEQGNTYDYYERGRWFGSGATKFITALFAAERGLSAKSRGTGSSVFEDGTVRGGKDLVEECTPKKGTIYEVPGEGTSSGKPYIGRHNKPDPAKTRRSPDGRDRSQAKVIDRYDANDVMEGRIKEQRAIDQRGGIKNLDNKRNEIPPGGG
jgi:hypothetical protein